MTGLCLHDLVKVRYPNKYRRDALCPGTTILEGLAVRGSNVETAQSEIARWLNRLGLSSTTP